MRRQKDAAIPGVKHIRIIGDSLNPAFGYSETWQKCVSAGHDRFAFWQKLNKDFRPDWILYSACNGVDFFLPEAFPDSLRVFYAHDFIKDKPFGKALNDLQLIQIIKSQLCFVFSDPATPQWSKTIQEKLAYQQPWLSDNLFAEPRIPNLPLKTLLLEIGNTDLPNLASFLSRLAKDSDISFIIRNEEMLKHLESKLKERIRLCVPVNLKQRLDLFRSADACLYLGNQTRTIMELMASYCPVILPDRQNFGEIGDFCHEITGKDAKSQIKTLINLINNGELLQTRAQKAQEWVRERFSASAMASGHIDAIKRAWDNARSPSQETRFLNPKQI